MGARERCLAVAAKKRKQREPSKASLREIPDVDFKRVKVRRNPYAARFAKEGVSIQVDRGAASSLRPAKLGR
jgi:hypothetical protein